MALLSHQGRPLFSAVLFAPIDALAAWSAGRRDRRASRATLLQLSELSEERLNDLGLDRQDLYEARKLDASGIVGLLYDRRNVRARNGFRSR